MEIDPDFERALLRADEETGNTEAATMQLERIKDEPWQLVERYVEDYPDDWRCVFKRGDKVLEISVPEEVWRAFDRA